MNRTLFFLLLLAGFTANLSWAEVINIDVEKAAQLQKEGVTLIDIRRQDEWQITGTIPGSLLLTYIDQDGNTTPEWDKKIASDSNKDKPVMLICRTGGRTKAAANILSEQAGYKTVYNIEGGIHRWIAAQKPIEKYAK